MALTAEQEKGVVAMLAAFQNGKRINELDAAKGALKDMRIEVMDETGETHSMELAEAVEQAGNHVAGRYWNTSNATPTAAGHYGSLQALRDLPAKLGLGRYLVTDDRKKRKLDPTATTKYDDGSPAALDGSQGQCMWCWNSFIANIFYEGGALVKCITFNKPVGNGVSIRIPAGGTSWLGAGVMDRTNQMLCSVISDAERFRGGSGSALKAASYTKAPAENAAQLTMLGMAATNISTTNFGTYARKRGEGWEANWFVAQFVVQFLLEVIMGTQNSQAAFNAEKDANGLYQGGFGTGVTDMPDWGNYNGYFPVIPTSVGLEAGDGVCLVDYNLPDASGGTYKAFKVPCFFGLMFAGYGHLFRWTRGLIMDAGEEKSEVYVSRSMFAAFDPSTVVAYYCVQFTVTWSRFVNTDAFTYVFGKDKPVFCMREFGPLAIAAEHFLVLLFKRIPIYVIIVVKRTGGRRNRLHTLLLKKPQTPWSSGFLLPSAHKSRRSIGYSACRTICVF